MYVVYNFIFTNLYTPPVTLLYLFYLFSSFTIHSNFSHSTGLALYPFESQRRLYSTFDQNFNFKMRRDHKKKIIKNFHQLHESVDVRSLFWVMSPIGSRKAVLRVSKGYSNCFKHDWISSAVKQNNYSITITIQYLNIILKTLHEISFKSLHCMKINIFL